MSLKQFGPHFFLVGLVISLLVGLAGSSLGEGMSDMLIGVLALLGVLVGLTNVAKKEAMGFLVASIALLQSQGALAELAKLDLVASSGLLPMLTGVISALVVFVGPAALVVALFAIYNLAGEGSVNMVPGMGKRR